MRGQAWDLGCRIQDVSQPVGAAAWMGLELAERTRRGEVAHRSGGEREAWFGRAWACESWTSE